VKTSEQMAVEFHEAIGVPVATSPAPLTDDRLRLRLRLIAEEVAELVAEMAGLGPVGTGILKERLTGIFQVQVALGTSYCRDQPDYFERLAKELCDVHVVVSGTAVEYGIPEDLVYEEVHRSNMAKAGGPVREDGKVLKPDGWTPPNVAAALQAAR
jgi:predicted HAD superfamily Cof-like phosphohydrolase